MSVVKEDPNSDIEEDDVELSAKGLSSPDVFIAKLLSPLYD